MKKHTHTLIIFLFTATGLYLNGQTLPTEGSDLFYGSGNCETCHSPGSPNTAALLDANGNDISMITYWRGTMMANAAKDPVWQAKVKAEIDTHPTLQAIIEDKCTTCHAPMGKTEAYYDGATQYTFNEMLADPLAMDGVSCAVCHQIQETAPLDGESFSGHFTITDVRLIYGPYENPVTNPMISSSNYTPVFSPHIGKSELCATCHTLFTPFVDDNANIIGEAPEQTPYLEWLNSDFPAEGIECQTCHVPRIATPITISNRPTSLGTQTPFGKHEFVGGNQYLLKLMKTFKSELGIAASDAVLDSVIARTQYQLSQHSISLSLESGWNNSDELISTVAVENLTGHKFPTAYPSRRAWLVFTITDDQGDTVFTSGTWDSAYEITALDSAYEPHHDIITTPEQVQIYQAIPKDHNGNKTYTLLRIAGYLKDNRIPPRGYTNSGIAADSTAIFGEAGVDPNFNKDGTTEGTGIDLVTYQVQGLNTSRTYTVAAKVVYQTLTPRFVADLLSHSGIDEVDRFASYYNQVPNIPFTVKSVSAIVSPMSTADEDLQPEAYLIAESYPNPFNPVTTLSFTLPNRTDVRINIFDISGKIVDQMTFNNLQPGLHKISWDSQTTATSPGSGLYFAQVITKHDSKTIKMMLLK